MSSKAYYSPFFPDAGDSGTKGSTIPIVTTGGIDDINTSLGGIKQKTEILDQNGYFDFTGPPQITGLTLTTTTETNADGSTFSTIKATWDNSTAGDFSYYVAGIKENDGNYVEYATGTVNYYQWSVRANQLFTVKIQALDRAGNKGAFSIEKSIYSSKDLIPPAPVTNLTVNTSFKSVYLNWTNPADQDLKGTYIYAGSSTDFTQASIVGQANGTPNTTGGYTHAALTTGDTYYYWITAVDTSGNESAATGPVSATTVSVSDADFSGSLGGGIPTVSTLPSNGVEGKYVYLSTDGQLYVWKTVSGVASWNRAVNTADLSGQIVGSQIVAGTIQAANIASGAVTTSKLGVLSDNLFGDSAVADQAWWTSPGTTNPPIAGFQEVAGSWIYNYDPGSMTIVGSNAHWLLYSQNGATRSDIGYALFSPGMSGISSNTVYSVEFTAENRSNTRFFCDVQWINQDGSQTLANQVFVTNPSSAPIHGNVQITSPSSTIIGYRLVWYIDFTSLNGNAFSGYVRVGKHTFRQANGGTMIVDGTITAAKIQAYSITADRIQAGSIGFDQLNSNSSLPGTMTIGTTGVSIGTVQSSLAAGTPGYNYVKYSLFEAGTQWWPIYYNPGGKAVNSYLTGTTWSKTYVTWGFTSSNHVNNDGNQTISVGCGAPSYGTDTGQFNPINGGIRIWAGANAQTSQNSYLFMQLRFVDLNNNVIWDRPIATWSPGTGWDPNNWRSSNTLRGTFVDVPVNAVGYYMEFYLQSYSTTNGADQRAWVGEVQLTVVSSAQTQPPAFNAGAAPNAASIVNAQSTTILPGKITISGATTLQDWRYGGDTTQINGGAIGANTITSNKLTVGNRNVQLLGITFSNDNVNTIYWSAGYVDYYDENYNRQVVYIQGGGASRASAGGGLSGIAYVWFDRINSAASQNLYGGEQTPGGIMSNQANVILASYSGGQQMNSNYGQTIIDGGYIRAQSITADRLNVTALSAITANIGLLRTAASGQRMELASNVLKVFDSNNVVRVQLGDLTA